MVEAVPVKLENVFGSPTTDVEAERFKQAQEQVRSALDGLLSMATAAGWGVQEIVVAISDAAAVLKKSHVADASPIEVPSSVQI